MNRHRLPTPAGIGIREASSLCQSFYVPPPCSNPHRVTGNWVSYPHLTDVDTEAWNRVSDLSKVSQMVIDTARSKRSLTKSGLSKLLLEGQVHLFL